MKIKNASRFAVSYQKRERENRKNVIIRQKRILAKHLAKIFELRPPRKGRRLLLSRSGILLNLKRISKREKKRSPFFSTHLVQDALFAGQTASCENSVRNKNVLFANANLFLKRRYAEILRPGNRATGHF